MKKILSLAIIILGVVTMGSCMRISRTVTQQKRYEKNVKLQNFERLHLDCAYNVQFAQGDHWAVKCVGSRKALSDVRFENKDGELFIYSKQRHYGFPEDNNDILKIYITSPDLTAVSLLGAGNFVCKDSLDTDTLQLYLKGAGNVELANVVCDDVRGYMRGVGNLEIEHLTSQQATFNLKGIGNVDVHIDQCNVVDCTLKGIGNIELSGFVKQLNKHVNGFGKIDTDDLTVGDTQED